MVNKLNYNGRKSGGTKLGQTIHKDILKSVNATLKSPKSPKSLKSRSPKDPRLEIYAEGKDLGDEGLEIICNACVQVLAPGTAKLDELNLAKNQITIDGLRCLTPVIRFAVNEIRDLDLRGNHIVVCSPEAEEIWEEFLSALSGVCNLRRLDLSENPLGDKAFEILWRSYTLEDPIHIPRFMRGVLTDSSDDEYESDEGDDMDMLYENIRQLGLATSQQTMGSGTSSQETTPIKDKKDPAGSVTQFPSPNGSPSVPGPELHGLRSVPYLILSCTGGTDASALFLSYIICLHPTLRRILPYLPLPKASQHEEYGKGASSNCQGVIYLPNDNFTVAATRVLHCAEKIRDPRRDGQWPSPNARNQRRSVHHEQAMFKTELERARNKIQGTILRGEDGLTVDIWKIALRTLVVGRIMLWRMENPLDFPRVVHRKAIDWPSQSSTSRRRASSSLSDGSLSPIESPVLHPSAAPSALSVVLDLNTVYDDPKLPGCLPVHIWTKIIAMATDPNMFLSDRQLKKVIEWGGSRCALEKERDFVGQTRYQQIWRVLDSMECLAYE